MADPSSIIIIRRGTTISIPQDLVSKDEATVLEQIAAKGDGALTQAEVYALKVILQRLMASP